MLWLLNGTLSIINNCYTDEVPADKILDAQYTVFNIFQRVVLDKSLLFTFTKTKSHRIKIKITVT